MKPKLNLNKFFPVSKPEILKQDIEYIKNSIKNGWVSSEGPQIKQFELNVSKFIGRKYATAVSSGTAALEIALRALKLRKKSEVIISNFTIISPALAIIKQGLKPVFVDVDMKTWNSNYLSIVKRVTSKTKCIIATHTYGYPMDIDKLEKFCKKKKNLPT